MAAASPAEWVQAGCLGVSSISLIALGLAFADADAGYFDPRWQVSRLVESGRLDALLVALSGVKYDARQAAAEARESAAAARYLAALSLRDAALTAAALLALLFPATGGTR